MSNSALFSKQRCCLGGSKASAARPYGEVTELFTEKPATLSTTNPTRTDLRSNPSLRDKKPGKNRMSHGTLMSCSHEFRILWKAKVRRRVHNSPHHIPLWWTTWIKHMPSHAFTLKFILILSFHLCIIVDIVSFPSSPNKTKRIFTFCPTPLTFVSPSHPFVFHNLKD
jgi:hypothetical protein